MTSKRIIAPMAALALAVIIGSASAPTAFAESQLGSSDLQIRWQEEAVGKSADSRNPNAGQGAASLPKTGDSAPELASLGVAASILGSACISTALTRHLDRRETQ